MYTHLKNYKYKYLPDTKTTWKKHTYLKRKGNIHDKTTDANTPTVDTLEGHFNILT